MARGNLTEKVTPEASEHAGAYLRKEHFRTGTNARAQNTTKLVLFQTPGRRCSWNEEGVGCSLPLKKVGLGDWYQVALVDQVK